MLLEQFLVHVGVERGLSQVTVRAYGSDIRRYIAWLEERGITRVGDVGSRDVEDYMTALAKQGQSGRSRARHLASIHEFHRFALAQGTVEADVSAKVKAPKSSGHLPDVLSVDEVAALLDAASIGGSDDPVVLRDKALLEFMYATGCRVSEAVGTDLADIDFDERVVRLTGKGAKQRLVPLGGAAVKALRRYLRSGAPSLNRGRAAEARAGTRPHRALVGKARRQCASRVLGGREFTRNVVRSSSINVVTASPGSRFGRWSRRRVDGHTSPNRFIPIRCVIRLRHI
ncbi:tyrosine recombinase XerD [Bifidobacterium bombi DSM 19703]|uniref:Tyrosine recombinase XerD n=1 Tax=Bifidobacterium bombi DSM 19703 TaxID=1341695 RepID=A0A080N2Y7_9BIFI|nr:tyrosine recombinase XerD [Bifidobacterium bombi DSM 19703]